MMNILSELALKNIVSWCQENDEHCLIGTLNRTEEYFRHPGNLPIQGSGISWAFLSLFTSAARGQAKKDDLMTFLNDSQINHAAIISERYESLYAVIAESLATIHFSLTQVIDVNLRMDYKIGKKDGSGPSKPDYVVELWLKEPQEDRIRRAFLSMTLFQLQDFVGSLKDIQKVCQQFSK